MSKNYPDGIARYIKQAEESKKRMDEHLDFVKRWKFDSIAVHGLYSLDQALAGGQGGIIEPILPSTSQAYRDSDEMEAALAYLIPTWCYTRIHNPTVHYLEQTLALLESYGSDSRASALCTASGMAAIKLAVEPLLDIAFGKEINFVSSAQVYGGTFQLFNVRMRERGASVRWVTTPWETSSWEEKIDGNTRFLYVEMPSNPQQSCSDLKSLADLAHAHDIPLIVDSTIATPALMRPILFGADVVIHSLTKTVGSGGAAMGGAIISRLGITSRHLADEAREDYAVWLKLWPFRDSGGCMSAQTAFYLLNETRTLRTRMELFSRNAAKVADFLTGHPQVERVDYLGLPTHPLHTLAARQMRLVDSDEPMFGHLMSFNVSGGGGEARRFFDRLKLVWRATDLGRIKSVATIPAISTHQQQGEEGRALAGIPPTMVRLCVGGEHPDDIIEDLDQALNKRR